MVQVQHAQAAVLIIFNINLACWVNFSADDILISSLIFPRKKRLRVFIQIVSLGENLNKM